MIYRHLTLDLSELVLVLYSSLGDLREFPVYSTVSRRSVDVQVDHEKGFQFRNTERGYSRGWVPTDGIRVFSGTRCSLELNEGH